MLHCLTVETSSIEEQSNPFRRAQSDLCCILMPFPNDGYWDKPWGKMAGLPGWD